MRHLPQIGLSVLIGLCLLNSVSVADLSAQISTNNPYRASTGWENLPEGRSLGIISGVIPDPEVYLMAAELLSLPPNRVMMVAAHKGDLRAAQRVGLKAAFVARPFERGTGRTVDTSPEPDFDYWASDFEDLAEQLGA